MEAPRRLRLRVVKWQRKWPGRIKGGRRKDEGGTRNGERESVQHEALGARAEGGAGGDRVIFRVYIAARL